MTPQCTVMHYNTKQPLINYEVPIICNNKKQEKKKLKSNKIKCVIVGDKEVGKTALAVTYSNATFPRDYIPTAYDNYNVDVQVDGKPIRLELCDTAGEDDLNPLRNLCYPGADVFILCYSCVRPSSYRSACTRWNEELSRLNPNVPIVLVGTQSDLRDDGGLLRSRAGAIRPITTAEGRLLGERLGAPFVETSAKHDHNLKEAFDVAITLALERRRSRRCFNWWRRLICC